MIDFQHIKILLTGSAAAGKTSFRRLLFRSKYSKEYNSTEVMEAQQATSIVNFSMLKQETNKEEVVWLKLDPENQIVHIKTLLNSRAFHQANTENSPEVLQESASTFDITDQQSLHAPNPADNSRILQDSDDNDKNDDDDGDGNNDSSNDNNGDHNDDHSDDDGHSHDHDENADVGNSASGGGGGTAFTDVEKKILSGERLPETMAIDKNEAIRLITVIDSGGQPEYINMLPAINHCSTINFVVLDMTKDLDDPVMVQYKSKHNKNSAYYPLHYSNLDMIGLLMSLTTDSLEQPTNEQIPTRKSLPIPNKSHISFVGTHKDLLEKSKQEEIIGRISDRLRKLTEGNGISVLAADKGILFPVDNTTAGDSESEDDVVKKLRKRIEKEINRLQSVNQLKITWMILELELQEECKKNGKKFVTYKDYKSIATEKASMAPEEIEESLHHFDFLGVFLHFKRVEGLCEYVIIDHQWLFDNLAMIMHLSLDDIDFQEDKKREYFKKKGLLAKDELPSVKWNNKTLLPVEFFFNLLIHLKVIATVKLDDVKFYYMSCIFPSTKQYTDKYRFLYGEPLLVQSSSGFLPRGFFCSLVVYLLEKLPTGWDPHAQWDNTEHFSNVFTFKVDDSFLRLHDKTSYLEIQIRHYRGDLNICNHSKIFHELSWYFTKVCEKLKFVLKKLQYGFLCHDGKSNDDHIVVIKPFEFPLPSKPKCSRNCQHPTKMRKLHNIWLAEVSDK